MLGSLHSIEAQDGVSMNPSIESSSPSLQRVYLRMGSKGRNILGNRHARPNLWNIFDFILEIGMVILDIMFVIGDTFLWAVFNFAPSDISGLPQYVRCDVEYPDCLEMVVRSGPVNRAAVAGTVLCTKNVPGRSDENTAKMTAPWIPAVIAVTRTATSALATPTP